LTFGVFKFVLHFPTMAASVSTFEIKIAFIGYKSVGKSTALNALLGDNYCDVSPRRPTAGVNSFRISTSAPNTTMTREVRTAESICNEIVHDNQTLTNATTAIQEKVFDIKLAEPLLAELRNDTSLVFIDIPGIRLSDDCPYKHYVDEKWDSFDCIVLVLDSLFQSSEEDQVKLLQYLHENLAEKRNLPIIVLLNQFDESEDEDEHTQQRKRFKKKIHNVFGAKQTTIGHEPGKSQSQVGILSYESDDDDGDDDPTTENATPRILTGETHEPLCVSVMVRNAYLYRLASRLSLDQVKKMHSAVLDKIGKDEVGKLPWIALPNEEKQQIVFEALNRQSGEYQELLEATNFYGFVKSLQSIIGGLDKQSRLLQQQQEVALRRISSDSMFVQELRRIQERFEGVETADDSTIRLKFWELYQVCEEAAFAKLEQELDVSALEFPIRQLLVYQEWLDEIQWEEDVMRAMRNLVRRQLHMIMNHYSLWSYDDWYKSMNAETWIKREAKHHWNYLSPADWSTILSSILLASCDRHFYEYFGKEKIALERYLFISNNRLPSPRQTEDLKSKPRRRRFSKAIQEQFMPADECPGLENALEGVYEEGEFIPRYRNTFDCIVRLSPADLLSDPAHWGYAAFTYCNLVRTLGMPMNKSFSTPPLSTND
jgi:GTPase SAR1 family protein